MRFDRTYVEKIESELAELRHENQQLHWQLANRCANCESGSEETTKCRHCGSKADPWFSRCIEQPCEKMHRYCSDCGKPYDCDFNCKECSDNTQNGGDKGGGK